MDSDEIKEALVEQRAMFQEMLKAYQETNAILKESLEQKDSLIEDLRQQIASLKRVIFGSRSEKTIYIDLNQKSLFDKNTGDNNQPEQASEQATNEKTIHIPAHERKAKRSNAEIYANLKHVKTVIDLPESQKSDEDGNPLILIGTDFVRSTLRRDPPKMWIEDMYCKKYKSTTMDSENTCIIAPDIPVPLIEHSYASASIVSFIIINKYFAGLPLYRQELIFKQEGVELSRTTMANWVITVSDMYLEKLYLRLCKLIVEQKVIHADETPIQVLKEPGKKLNRSPICGFTLHRNAQRYKSGVFLMKIREQVNEPTVF